MAKSKYIIDFEKKIPAKDDNGQCQFSVDDMITTLGIFVTRDGRKIVVEHMVLNPDMRAIVDASLDKEGLFPKEEYEKLKKKGLVSFNIDGFRKKVGNFVRLLAIENSTILRALVEKGENKLAINLLNSGEIFNIKLLVPVLQLAMRKGYLGISQLIIAMFIRKNKDEFAILGNKFVVESGISKSLMLGLFRKENFESFANLLGLEKFDVGAKVDLNDHRQEVEEFIEYLVEEKKETSLKNLCSLVHCKLDKKFTDKMKSEGFSKDLMDMLNSKPELEVPDVPKKKKKEAAKKIDAKNSPKKKTPKKKN